MWGRFFLLKLVRKVIFEFNNSKDLKTFGLRIEIYKLCIN
jgi:hypothetical protein